MYLLNLIYSKYYYLTMQSIERLLKLNLQGWHWLIRLYRFQVYMSMMQDLFIALCAHHPKLNCQEEQIANQGRERKGHVSPIHSADLKPGQMRLPGVLKITRETVISTGRGGPLKFCVYLFHYLGKEAFETVC